jgi:hypothetical protein
MAPASRSRSRPRQLIARSPPGSHPAPSSPAARPGSLAATLTCGCDVLASTVHSEPSLSVTMIVEERTVGRFQKGVGGEQ